jgi:hypothetical protein
MNPTIEAQLTQDAIKLDRLNREVVKAVLEWNPDNIGKSLKEYITIEVKIKTALIDFPVAKIHDHLAKNVLSKIGQGESFQADNIIKMLESRSQEKVSLEALDDSEIEQLGSDLFYSWYSHYEYIEALYDIGSLIVSMTIPESLRAYVSEARSCYAFQQYNAVYGLCRTILESAIRHTCERKGFIKKSGNVVDIESYKPAELINKVAKGDLRDRLKDIYSKTSTLLHGRKTINSEDAKQMFMDTLKAVQDLYK